ncbi:unnamed protein product [Caenorhabditis sp. 36 PRJEB53466]|nr:unnamed protein product [Caenorhabditis sp. 36 PRJEB53466]
MYWSSSEQKVLQPAQCSFENRKKRSQMMGYSQSRVIISLLLFSVLISICLAVPPALRPQELNAAPDEFLIYDEEPFELTNDGTGTGEPHEEKRAVFRMGKRAVMRFGKRAVMRFGKRSVFRLG